jgi:hypothetical protein
MSAQSGRHCAAGTLSAGPVVGGQKDGPEGRTEQHMAHDHEVIVENRGGGIGTILGVIVIIALLAGIWYFAFGPGQGMFGGGSTDQPNTINVNVQLPSAGSDGN